MVVPGGAPAAPSSSAAPMRGAHPGVHDASDGAGHRRASSGAVRLCPAAPRRAAAAVVLVPWGGRVAARRGPRGEAAAVAVLGRGAVGVVRLEGTGAVAHAGVVRARRLRPRVHPRLSAGVSSGWGAIPVSSRRQTHAPAPPAVLVVHHPSSGSSLPPASEVDEPAEALGQGRKALNAGHPCVLETLTLPPFVRPDDELSCTNPYLVFPSVLFLIKQFTI